MSNQIQDLYGEALQALAAQGLSFRHQMTNAKTNLKKKYYKKKLKQNSETAARLIVKLERLASVVKTKETNDEPREGSKHASES